jgi:ergothioneine biosynthesis protein EgtB
MSTPILDRYLRTRARTEALTTTLSAEDMQVQSMPDVSPTKWHLGHTTWFFETFVLEPRPGFSPVDERYRVIFNSYYEQVGAKHPRPERGLLTRPPLTEVLEYRQRVDASMSELLGAEPAPELAATVELGINHEEQHQELLVMDIKHVLGSGALEPSFRDEPPPATAPTVDQGWRSFEGGTFEIGHPGEGFAFDNEGPRHPEIVGDFELSHRLVTNREWLEFINDGGYREPVVWLSDGWAWRAEHAVTAPLTWRRDDGWTQFTLHGREPLRLDDPVTHISFYEADAFARWAGARLPTEAEWERAASGRTVGGHFLDLANTNWHPRPPQDDEQPMQLFGDGWEWTQSPYSPYPGFRIAEGAVGEYNGKFMANQFVLRGGSFATPSGHVRATYRNFFHPHTRWHFSGVRLARDV